MNRHGERKTPPKAILFDYIGTLVEPANYDLQVSKIKLHNALCKAGLVTNIASFIEAYSKAHQKYREVRYGQLKEVTNAIWVSEALNEIGCRVTLEDVRLKSGLNEFFHDFIDSLRLKPNAEKLVELMSKFFKIGLVSNFTYAPAIYASLRKLRISKFFNCIVVSESVGWRKPHRIIFEKALQTLHVKAEDVLFVGDSPSEDIAGAKCVGMRTIYSTSHLETLPGLEQCVTKPDLVIYDLGELFEKIPFISH